MGIVGVWLAVIGYAVAYTGIGHFQGDPNASLLASLGYAPSAQQQAQAAANAASPLAIFGDIFGSLLTPGQTLWNLISGIGQPSTTTGATTTTAGSSPGSLLV